MKRAFLTPMLLLAGCLPAFEEGAPVLHDIALYTPRESVLYGYFYGEPATITVGGEERELTEGTSGDPLAVPGALLIDGLPYLRQTVPPLDTPPVVVQRVPFSTDLLVEVREDVEEVLYHDGSRWLSVLEGAEEGERVRVVPRARPNGLLGVGELTRAEAEVFGREVEARAPVIVTVLSETRARTRQAGGLGGYRSTALALQRGVRSAPVVQVREVEMDELSWDVLASGTQAAGGESPTFAVATSQAELEALWRQAYGSLTDPPPVPEVDFRGSSVVAAFLGTKPTGGYSVDVGDVYLEDGEVYVDLEVTEPGPGTLTTQALTHPWVMIEVSRPDLASAWFRDADANELLGVARGGSSK